MICVMVYMYVCESVHIYVCEQVFVSEKVCKSVFGRV